MVYLHPPIIARKASPKICVDDLTRLKCIRFAIYTLASVFKLKDRDLAILFALREDISLEGRVLDIRAPLKSMNVLIVTHYYVHGPAEDLTWFLTRIIPTETLSVIKIPLDPLQDKSIIVEHYCRGNSIAKSSIAMPRLPIFSEAITRLSSYIEVLLRTTGIKYDIALAQDPVTTLLAIMLRRRRIAEKVIFQSHNYTAPERGSIYKFIDLYATKHADVVWALSKRLLKIRHMLGARNVIHVPVCIKDDVLEAEDDYDSKENEVVFIGALNKAKGCDILLKLLPYLVKVFDGVHIIGKGPFEQVVRKLSNINKSIVFHGYLPLKML